MIGYCIYAQKVSDLPYRFKCTRLAGIKRTLDVRDYGELCRKCLYRVKPSEGDDGGDGGQANTDSIPC